MTSTHCPLRYLAPRSYNSREGLELEARHSLSNLSVYDLVEDDTTTKKTRIKARAKLDSLLDSNDYCLDSSLDINSKDNLEDEEATIAKDLNKRQSLCESRDGNRTLHSRRNKRIIKLLARAYILYFKELLSNNSRIFASVIGITRTQAIKNEVVAIDSINSILCDLSDLLVVRFCIFSNSALENIGILINKKVVEIQTNTTTTLANKLTAINKSIIAEANMPTMHSKATKHCLALLAAQFALVCSFRKGRTVFNKFYNCKLESTIIAKFYKDL
ncbi:hypothetical protein HBH92_165910 [Parastagonospora nodorum]|nr:hypothetical protein HBH92_165910 [Parastagonospora nodorum]KAH4885228.1 hypothetical protein HBH59_023540 [Parastagonospora nodorum]